MVAVRSIVCASTPYGITNNTNRANQPRNLNSPLQPRQMTLEQAKENIGRKVIYRPYKGGEPEEGVISSVNTQFVFVRYGDDCSGQATSADDLEFIC